MPVLKVRKSANIKFILCIFCLMLFYLQHNRPNEIKSIAKNHQQKLNFISGKSVEQNTNIDINKKRWTNKTIVVSKSQNVTTSSNQMTSPISMTSEAEFARRRQRVQRVCATTKVKSGLHGSVETIFQHEASGVLYCSVPKTGCTFWKLLFKAASETRRLLVTIELSKR